MSKQKYNSHNPNSMKLHQGDIPSATLKDLTGSVAVDTETMGLKTGRDRLCLVQLCDSNRNCHMVQIAKGQRTAPNLQRLMENTKILKLFHFARFDLTAMLYYLGIKTSPVYCTRTASKLARTYSDKHGLRTLCNELLKIEIDKQKQSSNWGSETLSQSQLAYAAGDVLHLHNLKQKMDLQLAQEKRTDLAEECFRFLPIRAQLDVEGFGDLDLFAH